MTRNPNSKLVLVLPPYTASVAARLLFEALVRMPGRKTLTLISLGQPIQAYDLDFDDQIGPTRAHHDDFMRALDVGLETYAALVIRQFIPNTVEMLQAEDGSRELIQWTALYSAVLREGRVECLTAESVEHNCTHDVTGRPTPGEQYVLYKDLSDFFDSPLIYAPGP